LKFNTLHPAPDFVCPLCGEELTSGVGFRLGAILRRNYKLQDELVWEGGECVPAEKPEQGNLKAVGIFNCDNIRCSSWTDCFPELQYALVVVQNNRLSGVESYTLPEDGQVDDFAILESN
jgi:hypothetical protein